MLDRLKAFFEVRLNESGALPAIMAGAILISATAVLLAGFSVTLTRNAEINITKSNANYYLNSCESELEKVVFKTLPSQFGRDGNGNGKADVIEDLDAKLVSACQVPEANVKITKVKEFSKSVPNGQTAANSIEADLRLELMRPGSSSVWYSQEAVKFLDYSNTKDYVPSKDAYIESFDDSGDAVWVEPHT